ncbi:MAG TPA: PrsW family glutamic-type intramembrane protease [Anaeromyxobacter sp.]
MMGLDLALPLTAAASGAAWAQLAAWRAGHGRAVFAARALLGGVAAFGLAVSAYDAFALAGVDVRWEGVARADVRAALLASVIGLVEEGAKLAGLLLVVERTFRRRAVVAAAIGVAAGFSVLEAFAVLKGHASAPTLARAALAPVAHALLALPLAAGVASALRRPARAWLPLVPALLVSTALHAAGDLSLALPRLGRVGYAAALAAPAVVLFAVARGGSHRTAARARRACETSSS